MPVAFAGIFQKSPFGAKHTAQVEETPKVILIENVRRGAPHVLFDKGPPTKSFGGRASVKGNRQGALSRSIKPFFELPESSKK